MLAGLALKRRWRHRRRADGLPADRPNLVMGVNVQICWAKFADYFEVEPRLVPMEGDRYHLSPEAAVELCDENTIGVVAVLGSIPAAGGSAPAAAAPARAARAVPGAGDAGAFTHGTGTNRHAGRDR